MKNYEIQPNEEVLVDDGKRYAVKTQFKEHKDAPGNFDVWAVEEGAPQSEGNGTFPATHLECTRNEDGSWFVNGNFGEEILDEDCGGVIGEYRWSEATGLIEC